MRRVAVALTILLALTGLSVVYLNRSFLAAVLYEHDLLQKPEAYTELYFSDPTTLPIHLAVGTRFSFAIHNMEGLEQTYPYIVRAEISGRSVVLARGSVTLDTDARQTIEVTSPLAASGVGRVVVELTTLNQEISFHLLQ